MAKPKRYYWMKLKESFMSSDTIDYFMSQPNGANYVVLYQMLCLKTINTGGRMSRQIGEVIIPFDVEKIQRDCKWFSIDTIRIALNLYKAFGLVYEDTDGTLVLADHKNLVGSESDAASRMRASRENRPSLPAGAVTTDVQPNGVTQGVTNGEQCANIVTPDIRDKSLDIRDKSLEKREDILPGAETAPGRKSGRSTKEPAVISLTLNDKSEFAVTQSDIDGWAELYPAVNILQELRSMKGWLDANPTKRKTRNGIRRFVNGWLAREQDKGHPEQPSQYPHTTPARPTSGLDRLMAQIQRGDYDE